MLKAKSALRNIPKRMTKLEDEHYFIDDIVSTKNREKRKMYVREGKRIGYGSFGTVTQSYLSNNSTEWLGPYAIKRVIKSPKVESLELEILQNIKHPNLVTLEFFFESQCITKDGGQIFQKNFVMEYIPQTLSSEIHQYFDNGYKLPTKHIKLYTFQILRALLTLHSMNICHGDLKPSNILIIPGNGIAKICDFGSAQRLGRDEELNTYFCSRFYRAPELLLNSKNYTTQIDIWSFGCIIGEMLKGQPLFKGDNAKSQLEEIAKLLGRPTGNENRANEVQDMQRNLHDQKFKRFMHWFPNIEFFDVDFLLNVLTYNSIERWDAKQLMSHEFFDALRNETYFLPRGSNMPVHLPDLFNFSVSEKKTLGEYYGLIVPPSD
ncbi:ygk3p [Saccharomyces arboricola H-6]|uniref:Ygk3p n=1 Tax=Saccharomyces arboricola (strain H-6 / AS 2.3317 / CBS 10644) TaxID=1160507 RepID=J8PZH6_SACAR|nr:ygk3p [Saccharomyces arboricola H-6]